MKLLNGTIVLNANKDKNHLRLYFSENGEFTDCNHRPLDLTIYKGSPKEDVATALRELADKVDNL